MQLIIVETPYSAPTNEGVTSNLQYLKYCLMDCLARGESPFASHLFYTQFLDDKIEADRNLGINAGLSWYSVAFKCVLYIDRGLSGGMQKGLQMAVEKQKVIEVRKLHDNSFIQTYWPNTEGYNVTNIQNKIGVDKSVGFA